MRPIRSQPKKRKRIPLLSVAHSAVASGSYEGHCFPKHAPRRPFKSPRGRIELSTPDKHSAAAVVNMYRSPTSKRIRRGAWNSIVKDLSDYGGSAGR